MFFKKIITNEVLIKIVFVNFPTFYRSKKKEIKKKRIKIDQV